MTRYPKQGKGRRWTVVELRAIRSEWQGDTLADGDGLSGEVRVSGSGAVAVRWKYAFRWEDRINWFQAGTWPTTTLEEIRQRRDAARKQVRDGLNPNTQKQAAAAEAQRLAAESIRIEAERKAQDLTLDDLFEAWITQGVRRKDGNAEIKRAFRKDVLPVLGALLVRVIIDADIRSALETVVRERGSNRTAVSLAADIQQMFAWAEQRQPWRRLLADGNPSKLVDIRTIVEDDYEIGAHRTRVLPESQIAELANAFADIEKTYRQAADGAKLGIARPVKTTTQLACWICLSTLTRIGETLLAEWAHIDLEKRLWFIPKENVKGTKGKKQAHRVFLSDFSARQFAALKALTGTSRWCFPATADPERCVDLKTVTKQIGDRQTRLKQRAGPLKNRRKDNSLILAAGADGDWKPHDLRRTGATEMQRLGIALDVIDRCQNHVLSGSKIRRAYLHYGYDDEMKAAWQKLGEHLDGIMTPASKERASRRQQPLPNHLFPNLKS